MKTVLENIAVYAIRIGVWSMAVLLFAVQALAAAHHPWLLFVYLAIFLWWPIR